MVGDQPALPPVPQRPAVMAGNEIVAAQSAYSPRSNYRHRRCSRNRNREMEIVPSTSTSHKHFKRKEPPVIYSHLIFYLVFCVL